jgi:hypothetical protein
MRAEFRKLETRCFPGPGQTGFWEPHYRKGRNTSCRGNPTKRYARLLALDNRGAAVSGRGERVRHPESVASPTPRFTATALEVKSGL